MFIQPFPGRCLLAAILLILWSSMAQAQFRVLVSNDDGVGAEGISVLVEELRRNAGLEITVVAPAVDQSGSGDDISAAVDVSAAVTVAGYPATAVAGEPADSVLVAVLELLPEIPDLVVTGINEGYNITRDLAPFSGTLGAARWAARQGIPAIAVSQEGGNPEYQTTAEYVAALVQLLADDKAQGRTTIPFDAEDGRGTKIVLSINAPNCAGSLRGYRVVPLSSLQSPESYELVGDNGTTRTFSLNAVSNAVGQGCASTLVGPATDIDAVLNGFAAITPLTESLSMAAPALDDYRVLEALDPGGVGIVVTQLPGGGSALGFVGLLLATLCLARRRCS